MRLHRNFFTNGFTEKSQKTTKKLSIYKARKWKPGHMPACPINRPAAIGCAAYDVISGMNMKSGKYGCVRFINRDVERVNIFSPNWSCLLHIVGKQGLKCQKFADRRRLSESMLESSLNISSIFTGRNVIKLTSDHVEDRIIILNPKSVVGIRFSQRFGFSALVCITLNIRQVHIIC